MTVQIIEDLDQGSEAWKQARCGIPTASRFADILAKGEGKVRGKYLRELAADIMRGWPEPESYSNVYMDRGREQEAEARALYVLNHGPVQRVGFIRNGRAGCSPDSLIGDHAGLEIKTALGHIQVERLMRGSLPSEYVAQVQGSLWVSERDHWRFMSYSPGLRPLVITVPRDEVYIAQLAKAVDAFNDELDALVASISGGTDQFRKAAA